MNALEQLENAIRDTIATRPEMTAAQIAELVAAKERIKSEALLVKKNSNDNHRIRIVG